MRRSAKIYIIALIWGATFIQLFFNSRVEIEEEVIQTFAASDMSEYQTDILIWGEYGDASYDAHTVRNILLNTASAFGMTQGQVMDGRHDKTADQTFFHAQNGDQELSLQFVTDSDSGKSFLITELRLPGMESDVAETVRMLENFYEDIGIEYKKGISVQGSRPEFMHTEEMKAFADDVLEEIDGQSVSSAYGDAADGHRTEDVPFTYIVYGYTGELAADSYVNGKKSNICIVFDYDPAEKTTDICVRFAD